MERTIYFEKKSTRQCFIGGFESTSSTHQKAMVWCNFTVGFTVQSSEINLSRAFHAAGSRFALYDAHTPAAMSSSVALYACDLLSAMVVEELPQSWRSLVLLSLILIMNLYDLYRATVTTFGFAPKKTLDEANHAQLLVNLPSSGHLWSLSSSFMTFLRWCNATLNRDMAKVERRNNSDDELLGKKKKSKKKGVAKKGLSKSSQLTARTSTLAHS